MPMRTKPAPELIERAKELAAMPGWNLSRIARELKWDRATARKYAGEVVHNTMERLGLGMGGGGSLPATPAPQEKAKWSESEEAATFTGITDKPIKTLDELIAVAEVDTNIWYVKSYECTAWTVGMKVDAGEGNGAKKPVQTQQYRVNAKFERIIKRYISDAYNSIDKWRKQYAPKYPKAFKPKSLKSRGNYLAILGLFDVHLGKLCWAKETGNNYDLKIAERVFEHAVEDLIAESAHRKVANWVLPVGNDFFHIDGYKAQTTAGTPMDADGRYPKIFETGFHMNRRAIELLLTTGGMVDIYWIPGNHDRHASYHLCRELAAHFRNCEQVNVDTGAASRKYFAYGSNLIGFTHGDKIKPDRLPNLMASERTDWSSSKCRDWYIGHLHTRKSWVTKPVETFEGSTVRVVKSLTGTDAWHFEMGYVDSQQAAEVFFYERDNGYAGHGVARARA